jgi:hypothetical protein
MAVNIISFDYEGVLDQPEVLEYAKELQDRGYELAVVCRSVIITELLLLLEEHGLDIPDERIVVISHNVNKFEIIKIIGEYNYVFHLDRDIWEAEQFLHYELLCDGIHYNPKEDWKSKCETSLLGRCMICGGKFYHKLSCPTGKVTILDLKSIK